MKYYILYSHVPIVPRRPPDNSKLYYFIYNLLLSSGGASSRAISWRPSGGPAGGQARRASKRGSSPLILRGTTRVAYSSPWVPRVTGASRYLGVLRRLLPRALRRRWALTHVGVRTYVCTHPHMCVCV